MGIRLEHISYKYLNRGAGEANYAIEDISLTIEQGEYVAIVGCTGSGKSTLLQHMNGLLKPESGSYICDGENVYEKGFSMKKLRQKVALCFQYPEYQLFEETVLKDVCYGPLNMGEDPEHAKILAREAMEMVGLSKDIEEKSPFTLSGGQKRRVALAGILAMHPDYLILDEPVAGLDEIGKKRLFQLLKKLNEENKITIIIVSHDMDDVIANAKRVIVLKYGRIAMDGSCREVFSKRDVLDAAGLEVPLIVDFYQSLMKRWGFACDYTKQPVNIDELAKAILSETKKNKEDVGCFVK